MHMRKTHFLSRRDFLKISGLSAASLAFERFSGWWDAPPTPSDALFIVRVTTDEINIYTEPDYESNMVGSCKRDELLYVFKTVTSPYGPTANPRWYQIEQGFVHTRHLQRVETHLNEIVYNIPETKRIAEVTVPMTLSFRYHERTDWQPLYRLYYQSIHWVKEVGYGPNGHAWYGIEDDLLGITYHVPAKHMRLIDPEEVSAIHPEVPAEYKWVLVDLSQQTVTAFEDNKEVFHTDVSTGLPNRSPQANGIPTITPGGSFNINIKMPVRHMGNGEITSDYNAYELPGVPWVSYFYQTGVAFHGCYWHDNYGYEMSHGCVNMRPEEAKWIYRWSTPETPTLERVTGGHGTFVRVVG